jgi:hypothetical protein
MLNRSRKTLAATGATLLAALGLGGAAIAASNGSQPQQAQTAPPVVQSSEKPGSEVAADDGPGGHADEPGNPNADHQFQGKE